MTLRLPFRPLPFPLESAIGYLLRLGAANDFPSLTWLQAYCKHSAIQARSFEVFFAQSTGHDRDALLNLWGPSCSTQPIQPEKKLGIKATYWNLHHRRWCPDCLREQGYWKAEWLLTLQIGCPTHHRLLQEDCPSCKLPINWYNGELLRCRCGQSLTETKTAPLTPVLTQLAQLVTDKFSAACGLEAQPKADSSSLSELLQDVHLARLLDLLWAVGSYTRHRSLCKPLKVCDHHRIKVALPVLESVASLLADWPKSFHDFLSGLSDQSQQYALDLRSFLGLHLRALNTALRHPELHFVRREFERFVSNEWKGVITDRHHFSSENIKIEQLAITAKEAAETLGISRHKLSTLVDKGIIQGWWQQTSGRRRFLTVNRDSVLRFQQGSAGQLFTLVEAAAYLGTTRSRVRLFVEASLINPVHQPDSQLDQHAHWAFTKAELDRLLHGLTSELHTTPDCTSVVSLAEICRGRTRDGADLVTLLQALQRGELTVNSRDPCRPGIQGLLLDRQKFETWFAARLPEKEVFALAAAARYLGLKEHVLYWLRDRGLLNLGCEDGNKRKLRLSRASLDHFKERYVWGRGLGALTGFGEKSASRAMLGQGVWPITGPTVDGGTTYLFLRVDVLAYLARRATEETMSD